MKHINRNKTLPLLKGFIPSCIAPDRNRNKV